MKKFLLVVALLSGICASNTTNSAWSHDGYGYISNVCRSGPYYQFVEWNYVGTTCYMPAWNLYGKRTAE